MINGKKENIKDVHLEQQDSARQHGSSKGSRNPLFPLKHTHTYMHTLLQAHTHASFTGEEEGGVNKQYKMRLNVQPAAVTTETIATPE